MNLNKIGFGSDQKNGIINVFIEIPKDSSIKYELDKESGVIFVDRFLYTAMAFPFNYGFVPNTKADDNDPLDVLVISEKSVAPGVVIPSKIIGMLEMEDESGIDTKILAVPVSKIDPLFGEFNDINDIPDATKAKIKHFFENYKTLEKGKWVKIKEFLPKDKALVALEQSLHTA